MSRRTAPVIAAVCAFAGAQGAQAQESEPPSIDELVAEQRETLAAQLTESAECTSDEMQPDTIVVCQDRRETEQVMSVLPRPVESDRIMMPGLNDPPCWVTKAPGVLCVRAGWTPRFPELVDVTAFPEPLNEEDAARVFAIEDLPSADPAEALADEARVDEARADEARDDGLKAEPLATSAPD